MTRHHFAALLFVAGLGFASESSATIYPLDGATPQHAFPNERFPNPIGVYVTDADGHPVPGAKVHWTILVSYTYLDFLRMDGSPNCFYDLGLNCSTMADSTGRAFLPSMYGRVAGTYRVPVSAYTGPDFQTYLGAADIILVVDSPVPAGTLSAVSGSGQRTVIGTEYASPFVVRVTRADGTPVEGADVSFQVSSPFGAARGTFANPVAANVPESASAVTDASGYARASAFKAGWGTGAGSVRAAWFDSEAAVPVATSFDFFNTNARGGTALNFQDLWWAGEAEAGWGVSITQHGDTLFSLLFTYNDDGTPTWYSMSTGLWEAGVGSTFRQGTQKARGTPFFAYDASKLLLEPAGGLSLAFNGEEKGALQGNMFTTGNDGRVLKNLQRFDFTTDPGAPMRGVADLWWGGPSQSGWGIAIAERPGGLFSMWFTYDETGKATWFAMPEGRWVSDNVFEGRMYSAVGSRWLGTSTLYDVSKFHTTDVGPYRLTFFGPNAAQLEYNVNGRSGTLSLTRTPFGDDR